MIVKSTVDSVRSREGNRRTTDAQCYASSTGRRLSGLLVVLLVAVSFMALLEVRRIPLVSPYLARSTNATQTIRSFYAGLNEYMETGDAGAVSNVLAPDALVVVPAHGAMGADSGLLTYLMALRSTLPDLRFTVEKIESEGDIAIATVRRSGIEEAPFAALGSASGVSQEFFRVSDGRITQQWTTEPDTVLTHPLTTAPAPVHLLQSGHLAIAELTFAPHAGGAFPVDGPALLLIEQGSLTLIGDGFSQLLDLVSGVASAPGPDERVSAKPGQAIVIPAYRAHVQNDSPDTVVARIATLVQDSQGMLSAYPADRPRPPEALNHFSTMRLARTMIVGPVTVRPLGFDNYPIPAGEWEVEIVWVVLGPGTTLPPAVVGDRALAHIMTDSEPVSTSYQNPGDLPDSHRNDGSDPVTALMIRVTQLEG